MASYASAAGKENEAKKAATATSLIVLNNDEMGESKNWIKKEGGKKITT